MSKELNELELRMKSLKDDALRKIVYIDFDQYSREALEIAKSELFSRYPENIWEDDKLTLKKLITYSNPEEVLEKISELFPSQNSYISDYQNILKRLNDTKPKGSNIIYLLLEGYKGDNCDVVWNVIGVDKTTGERFELEYCEWAEWLAFHVYKHQLQMIGKEEYISYCLMKMTIHGFDESDIKDSFNEFEEISENQIEYSQSVIEVNESVSMESFIVDGIEQRKKLKEEYKEKKHPEVRPLVRLFARNIDLSIWMSSINILLPIIFADIYKYSNRFMFSTFINISGYLIWLLVEAFLLSTFGFTLGKWLLNVYVRDKDGNRLLFWKAAKRAFLLFIYGEGSQLPVVYLITYTISYSRLKSTGITKWDELCKTIVTHKKIEAYKIVIAVIILTLPLFRIIFGF